MKHVDVDVVNDKHIILFGFGSRILSSFKVIERDSKPFLWSKEGEKAEVNRFKCEVEYHTIITQTKFVFVFVFLTILEGCFSSMFDPNLKRKQLLLPKANDSFLELQNLKNN